MTDLLSLADIAENADTGSRELDMKVCEAVGWKGWKAVTTSVDAALSLVPDGYFLCDIHYDEVLRCYVVKLAKVGGLFSDRISSYIKYSGINPKFIPLAITAASLRALAQGVL